MRVLFTIVLLLLSVYSTYGQTYQVFMGGFSGTGFYSPRTYTARGSFGSINSSSSSFTVPDIPTSFSITFATNAGATCQRSAPVDDPTNPCTSGSAGDAFNSCGGGGTTWGISMSLRPILSYESGTSPIVTTTAYCQDDDITLVPSAGFGSYAWQYKVENGPWVDFNPPRSGNSRTFGIQDIFGVNFSDQLAKNIFFRYKVGSCSFGTVDTERGPYVFNPLPATITGATVSGEVCLGDRTTQIAITGLSRPPVSGENFIYELRSSTDLNVDALYSTASTVINGSDVSGGIPNGNYFILTISDIAGVPTGCGDPIFVPIEEITGPTDAITPANAGANQTICSNTANISGNSLDTDETGIWTRVSGSGTIANPNNRSTSITGLGVGNNVFEWTVTQNPFGCTNSDRITITRINTTTSNAGNDQTVCNNSATLLGNAPGTGENGSWTLIRGTGNFSNATSQNTTVSGLSEGDNVFQWTIRDNGNICSNNDQVTINFTDLTTPNAGTDQQACSSNVVLNANTVAAGEIGTWSVITGTGTFDDANTAVTTVSDLSIGTNTFRWTIADGGGNCPSQIDDVIVELTDLEVSELGTLRTNPSCFGESDGSITFTGSGGIGIPTGLDYEFTLSNGEQMFADAGVEVTFSGLLAGTYSVVIQDDQCIRSSQTVVLTNPSAISVSEIFSNYNGQQISCNGQKDGEIILDVSGGNGGFTFDWSNGATTKDISNLTAGTYTVTITDLNGCESIETYILDQPFVLEGSTIETSVQCNGEANGAIDLDVTGGTAPYTYSWSNGAVTQDVGGLAQGSYSVTIIDVNGCDAQIDNIQITEPTPINIVVDNQTEVACNGESSGEVTLLASGGTGTKEYSIDGINFQTNPIFSNLPADDYTFFTRDNNGCDGQLSVTVTEPPLLTSSVVNEVNSTCNEANGSALAVVSGGTGTYSFDWRDANNQQVGASAQLSDVNGGIYTVTITDENGCTNLNTATISSIDGAQIINEDIVPASCFNTNDGQATLTVDGVGPFTIDWNNGETGLTAVNLSPGSNLVSISDNNGCTTVEVVDIPAPDAIVATLQGSTIPTCHNSNDGSISIDVSGGTGAYAFAWSTGSDTNSLNNITAGEYQVIITDGNGCSLDTTFSLSGVDPLSVEVLSSISPTCEGGDNGMLQIQALGGNGNYTYVWSNNSTTPIQNNLSAGGYQVSIIDDRGCTETFDINLPDAPPLDVDLGGDKVICTGSVLTISAPIDNASYLWTSSSGFRSTDQEVVLDEEDNYTLQVTNADGCVATDNFTLTASDDLLLADFLMVSEAYTGDTIVMIDISWPIPESLSWDYGTDEVSILTQNMDFSEVVFNTPGTYEVSIQTGLGDCIDIEGQIINILDRANKDNEGGRLSSQDEDLIKEFKAYPNPNAGEFGIRVELIEEAEIQLAMIDIQGNQSIWEENLSNNDIYDIPVNLPQLRSGIYLLLLRVGDLNKVLRVVVR